MATYRQLGDVIDYTPSSAVTAGDVVVQGDLVAVATNDIAADVKGTLTVKGVFAFTKNVGSTDVYTFGQLLYWDATNEYVSTSSADGKLIGKCVKAAADSDLTVEVRLNQ